ncbi:RidA family protein [Falsiroseomonas ponticola]|jgi:2-iminobutanoate/2-iminopropanoate deaminase|uniref:RidA family protein n=1 Tax=Falsiroseomonas ponticola TaxID=2786951 RepID=UPI0019317ABE|nr:RidA family protein [Roseomonas ponticola]
MRKVFTASPPEVPAGESYEQASRAGDFIFLSGQVAKDENGRWVGGDAANQARQIWRNIDRVLAHMGATKDDIAKVTTILTDVADREAVTAVRLAYLGDHRPPHTGLYVPVLGRPQITMEVEVIAYAPKAGAPAA